MESGDFRADAIIGATMGFMGFNGALDGDFLAVGYQQASADKLNSSKSPLQREADLLIR